MFSITKEIKGRGSSYIIFDRRSYHPTISGSQSDNENTTVEIVDDQLDAVLEVLGGFVVGDPFEMLGNDTCDDITAFQNNKEGKTDVDHEDNDDYRVIQRSLGLTLYNEDDKNDRKKLVKRVEKKEEDKKEDEDNDYEFDADSILEEYIAEGWIEKKDI
ncbi:hypothetical protein BD770DRAFT_394596, partial [Pilaira anomala]